MRNAGREMAGQDGIATVRRRTGRRCLTGWAGSHA
jgi:hypothetical protein